MTTDCLPCNKTQAQTSMWTPGWLWGTTARQVSASLAAAAALTCRALPSASHHTRGAAVPIPALLLALLVWGLQWGGWRMGTRW